MHDLHATLTAYGLRPRALVSGKWIRCATDDHPKKRNGAYRISDDGRMAWFKNWATDADFNIWNADGALSPAKALQAKADTDAARRREAEYRKTCITACRAYWSRLPMLRGVHPYLAAKQLDMLGCGQLRTDGELLAVPVMRDGQIMSVQTIAADGQKRFRTGCPVKGGVFVLERTGASLTCFVEGLATGLAVFSSLKQSRVVVCFDSGNLIEVAAHFQGNGLGIVCADNDHETARRIGTNPGLDAARKAANALGCGIAYPDGINGSDWADAIVEREDARRWIARQILMKAKPFKFAEAVP
ncbi:MAG: toprim domain-containing protein [Burkholderiaceae bacterium]